MALAIQPHEALPTARLRRFNAVQNSSSSIQTHRYTLRFFAMKILTANLPEPDAGVLSLPNDADPREASLEGIHRVDLHFPKFTDGRAYSQAFWLRRRLGFQGEIRATGDVLIDQLVQMSRCGFDVAVLKAGVDATDAQAQFDRYARFYQADASNPQAIFS
jgi:uncharacterized protein (DUF934 family)